jgi:hypothetical protein
MGPDETIKGRGEKFTGFSARTFFYFFWVLLICGGGLMPLTAEAAVQKPKDITRLIEEYVKAKKPSEVDRIDPRYYEILGRGKNAVPAILKALERKEPEYKESRTELVCLLGQIGDLRAYDALRRLFLEQTLELKKWRYGVSLGACLTMGATEDFVTLLLGDETGAGRRVLKENSGKDLSNDAAAWLAYLKQKKNLNEFRKKCRERSAPILG